MKKYWFGIDLIFLALFVSIGRANHHDGLTIRGLANTFWPFFLGWLAGWVALRRSHRDPASRFGGFLIVLSTVALGMALRVILGQGTAVSFIIVATLFLSLFLVGARVSFDWYSRRANRG